MKKIVSILSAFAFFLSNAAFPNLKAKCADSKPIKIMAIGDSITDGYGVAGSYRKYLYNELTKKGYNIDMVGSKGNNMLVEFTDYETGESFMYDDDNTGYSGYAIKEYPGRNGILETLKSTNCLETCKPDIVILQIGTNDVIDNYDIDNSYKRIGELLTYIYENIPESSALFVTTIPDVDPNRPEVYNWFNNYRHSADWQTNYPDDEVEEQILKTLNIYNANVLCNEFQKRIITSMVNLHPQNKDENEKEITGPYFRAGFISEVITDVKTQFMDGVHPNNKGYKLMGEYWADMIDSYLKNNQTTDEPYTVSDLVKLQKYILGSYIFISGQKKFVLRYDINNDSSVDVFDVIALRKKLLAAN